ncbi:porin [Halomonas koreensis]|uniref:Porin n=1 Tax=Halomonas koreensis TaxID=245385 RepID=A0ABU1G5E9_9GAMM|nr:porin [Halomonas koreensis]MDR5868146.1 porin [Halomonas koreensis]
MKKTLLATAIAGAMAASGAQAATVYNQDGTKLDIYGNIQIAYYNTDDENGDSRDEIADNGTTFGFAAEHVIYDGLTGYLKLELDDIKADEMKTATDAADSGDTAYVGLRGNFGDVRLGSYDSLMDDWIQDPITNNEGFDVSDTTVSGVEETDKITYTSPVFSGFQFALGTQYKGDAESENVTDSGDASFFGGVKYAAGAFSIAAVYDNLDTFESANDGGTGKYIIDQDPDSPTVGTVVQDDAPEEAGEFGDRYGVTAQYTIDSLRLAAKYETFDSDEADDDVDFMALGARYGYGMGDVYGAYQNVDSEASDDDRDEVIIGATYTISDAMYTWAEANWEDRDNDEGDGFGVGITYLF